MNPNRPRRLGSTVPFGLVLLAVSGFAAGCGSSNGGGGHGDADNFVGLWTIDPDSAGYVFSGCQTPDGNGEFGIWSNLTFEYGELTDLTETSGGCFSLVTSSGGGSSTTPGLPYDVSGDTASLPTTDPYTSVASSCIAVLGSDAYGTTIAIQLTPVKETWQFKLQPPASGEPRRAELGVKEGGDAATADILAIYDDGLVPLDSCKLSGAATFFRVSTE